MTVAQSTIAHPINSTHIEPLKKLFQVSSEKNALSKWQLETITAFQDFLNQDKQQVLEKYGLVV